MKYVLAYVKETLDYSIIYHQETSLQPVGFVDLDFTNDKDTWRFTKRHVFYTGRGLILWATKWQETVVISATEVEYMAVS